MAKKHSFDYDLIVIGSGAGGSAAATIASREGKKVAIIEEDTFGGDSPNYSDVPTKALLHAAQLYDEARHGARFVPRLIAPHLERLPAGYCLFSYASFSFSLSLFL